MHDNSPRYNLHKSALCVVITFDRDKDRELRKLSRISGSFLIRDHQKSKLDLSNVNKQQNLISRFTIHVLYLNIIVFLFHVYLSFYFMQKIEFWEIISNSIFAKEKFNFTKKFAKSTGEVVQ